MHNVPWYSALSRPCTFHQSMVYFHYAPCTLEWCSSTIQNASCPMVWCTFIMNYAHLTLVWCTSTMHHGQLTIVKSISTMHSAPLFVFVRPSNMHFVPSYSAIPLCITFLGIVLSHLLVLCTKLRCTSTMHLSHSNDVVPPFRMHHALWYGALS